jgi:hypothetical protein
LTFALAKSAGLASIDAIDFAPIFVEKQRGETPIRA